MPDILHRMIERPHHADAFNAISNGVWSHFSTIEVIHQIHSIALALNQSGIKKGDRIGILAKSSPRWSIADFAIVLVGGITVPFFSNLSNEHFHYQIDQTEPRLLFVGDEEDLEHALPYRDRFQKIVALEIEDPGNSVTPFQQLLHFGENCLKESPEILIQLEALTDPEDVATIIYSSGSTGYPKGVELTHKNLVAIIAHDDFSLRSSDKYLSILPLPHIFAKQIHLAMTAWGVPIYFLNDPKKFTEVTSEIPITRMITVPRLLEKAYAKIYEKASHGGFIKRAVSTYGLNLAHREGGFAKFFLHPIFDLFVYSKIRNNFGKHFHSILSGGAALNPRLHRFLLNIGIPVLQGWGLTEGSCMAVNRLWQNKIGTVGPPVKSVSFKISDEGEILASGPTIMKGYFNNKEATKNALDREGWLHTGDLGYIDQDGHLVVEGRINETFKTSHGEFINPSAIEQRIYEFPLFEMAMVIGENRPFVSVFLFPESNALERLKQAAGYPTMDNEEFIQSDFLKKQIEVILGRVNQELDHWQKIRKYQVILELPSIEKGELTPTLKLKRKALIKRYKDLIGEMYREEIVISN